MEEKELQMYLGTESLNLVEAMQRIDCNAKGILYIVNANGQLCGSVTDGDIRRWIINTGKLDISVDAVMNTSPVVVYIKDINKVRDVLKEHKINSVPVLDMHHKVVDVFFLSDAHLDSVSHKQSLKSVPLAIMAGGKGTRLYPYTRILPKPLIPIGDIPILERIMNCFEDYGVNQFYITLNYKKNMIKSYLSDIHKEKGVTYIEEPMPLGTAGSLRLIQEDFSKPLFVTNCDILVLADYGKIWEYHCSSDNCITIVSAMKKIEVPYGVVTAKENGVVIGMSEKPKLSYLVNTGMYVINPEVLQWIPEGKVFHMTDLVEKALKNGKQVGIYPVGEDVFLDMGEVNEMKRMEEKLKVRESI